MAREHDLIRRPQFASSRAVVWLGSLCSALLFVALFNYRPATFILEMEVRTKTCSFLQVRAKTGLHGDKPERITRLVDSRRNFQKVRFALHARTLSKIRLLLFRGPGSIELRAIKLLDPRRHREIPIPAEALSPNPDIASMTQAGDVIRLLSVPAAGGPQLLIKLPQQVKSLRSPDWGSLSLLGALALSLAGLFSLGRQRPEVPQVTTRMPVDGWVIAGLTLLYLVACGANLNGSSTAIWKYYADRELPRAGLLAGAVREIRSDEWMVQTPWIFSQARQRPSFPLTNRNVGDGLAPLLNNLPVHHWSMLFRPQMWGFLFFDLEHAFALNWNFKWFGLLLSGFLFFQVLDRNRLLVSLGGALFLLFSSYTQWWFSTPTCMPEMIAMIFFALWALATILNATTRLKIAGAGLVLLVALQQFVFCSYPGFQIPLLYFGFLTAAGLFLSVRDRRAIPTADPLRIFRYTILTLALLVVAGLAAFWLWEISGTLRLIANLVYPGQRFYTGGTVTWTTLLAPFLEWHLSEDHYPEGFGNVCESAGFLLLAPIVFLAVFSRGGRGDPILLAIVLFLASELWFVIVGIPPVIARYTGWSYVSGSRALLGFGVATIAGAVRLFAHRDQSTQGRLWPERELGLDAFVAGGVAVAFYLLLRPTNIRLGHFVTEEQIIGVAIFFVFIGYALFFRRVAQSWTLLVVPLICFNLLVNPVSRGLPGLTRNETLRRIQAVTQESPLAKWLLAGNNIRSFALSQLLKAGGGDVIGGTRCMPDRQLLRQLDPANQFAKIHDRYARVCFVPTNLPRPTFRLWFIDAYGIFLPLHGPWLSDLSVDNLVLVDQPPSLVRPPGFTSAGAKNGCYFYRRDQ